MTGPETWYFGETGKRLVALLELCLDFLGWDFNRQVSLAMRPFRDGDFNFQVKLPFISLLIDGPGGIRTHTPLSTAF